MQTRPKIAIIDPNTLSALGLKGMLQNVMPIMTVDIYGSFAEFTTGNADEYFHFFTNVNIVLDNRAFFNEHRRKTIVLTTSAENQRQAHEPPGGYWRSPQGRGAATGMLPPADAGPWRHCPDTPEASRTQYGKGRETDCESL